MEIPGLRNLWDWKRCSVRWHDLSCQSLVVGVELFGLGYTAAALKSVYGLSMMVSKAA